MAERTSYEPGTPSWVDLGSPDPEEAAAFYEALFGWKVEADPRPEAGGYRMCMLDGKNVAGLGPQQNADMPPFWTVYVTVADTDDTVAKVKDGGGEVVVGPMDVFDAGRMAVLRDAVGSFVSIWQPDRHIGASLVNEPGTFTWNELATTDLPAARTFYQTIFGWGLDERGSGDHAAVFTVGGSPVCGAHVAGEGEHPGWSVWFAVEDCDVTAGRAGELGGRVLMPPTDMDFGRGAIVADPHGAVFGVASVTDTA